MRKRRIAALLATAGTLLALPAAASAAGVTATFTKTSDWGSGFVGSYTIRNDGAAPASDWKLEFDLPSSEHLTSTWSAKLTVSGNHVVLTPEDWTRTIAPGASVEAGLQGDYATRFTPPANCAVNGQPCAGGGGGTADTTPPTAPTGLTASNTTASTVALRWKAATDNVGVTRYRIYQGNTKVNGGSGTSATVGGLQPSTTYTFTVRAVDAAGNVSAPSDAATTTTTAAGGGGSDATAPRFAPYVDMTLSSDSLAQTKAASGDKHFTLAFIVSGGACTPSWGGYYGLGDAPMAKRIADLQAAGGDAIVSFGGAAGQELARTCSTPSTLAAAYQSVIDRYGIRDLDFDVEGADVADPASIDRRSKAIAQVQAAGAAAGKPVHVSLTLPVMPTGLTADGLNVVRSAITNGADVGVVNVMAMDYFDSSLAPYHMGDLAIQAAQRTHDQLATLYPGRADAALWKMVGVTPMLGINDDNQEIFTTADATKLQQFATAKGLGRLAMWDINRDHPCGRPTTYTELTCSGVPDADWAFSAAFRVFGS